MIEYKHKPEVKSLTTLLRDYNNLIDSVKLVFESVPDSLYSDSADLKEKYISFPVKSFSLTILEVISDFDEEDRGIDKCIKNLEILDEGLSVYSEKVNETLSSHPYQINLGLYQQQEQLHRDFVDSLGSIIDSYKQNDKINFFDMAKVMNQDYQNQKKLLDEEITILEIHQLDILNYRVKIPFLISKINRYNDQEKRYQEIGQKIDEIIN